MLRALGPVFSLGNMSIDLVAKTAIDRKVAEIIDPMISEMGFELVRVRLISDEETTLQIMADRAVGGIEVDDLADISTSISAVLDVEDPICNGYNLEVSSPGIDRPLTRFKDFDTFEGYEAKLETEELIDGRRRFKGVLAGTHNKEILINLNEGTVGLKFEWLSEAKLVLTEELITEMLRKQKTLGVLNEKSCDEIKTGRSEEEI